MDVNTATRKAVAVYVEQLFGNEGEGIDEEVAPVLDEELGDSQEEVLISFEEFRTIMEEYDVIPIFVNPHKFAQHKQVWQGSLAGWVSFAFVQQPWQQYAATLKQMQ